MAKFKPDLGAALKAALKKSQADEQVASEVGAAIARLADKGGHSPEQIEAIALSAIARTGLMSELQAAIVAEIVRAASERFLSDGARLLVLRGDRGRDRGDRVRGIRMHGADGQLAWMPQVLTGETT